MDERSTPRSPEETIIDDLESSQAMETPDSLAHLSGEERDAEDASQESATAHSTEKQRRKGAGNFLEKMRIRRIDKYIIHRFLSTFGFALSLIMVIIVAIDIQEKLEVFMRPEVSATEILKYYVAMIPYFAVLLTPLFIFITVVYFTSKLASRSEIIAMQSTGMSFIQLLKPYMISAAIIAVLSFVFSSEIIPKLNVMRVHFEDTYVFPDQKVVSDRNVQVMIGPGKAAYFGTFDIEEETGYQFSLEYYEDNTLRSRMTGASIKYDSLYHWTVTDYNIRDFEGLKEVNTSGESIDTMLFLTPQDVVIGRQAADKLRTGELVQYINNQKKRGVGNIQAFQVELHRRFASILAAFILTIIGVSLSARKVKGGIGLNVAIGLLLAFGYILLFTISSSYAVSGALSPLIAAWLPNIIYIPIAAFFYFRAPR